MAAELQLELEQLLGSMCDGTLTAVNYARLDELLQSDDAARRFYNNYMFMHAALYSQHAALGAIADFGLRISNLERSQTDPQFEIRNPKYSRWVTLVAALIGVAAVSSWLTYMVGAGAKRQASPMASVEG